jgi:phenylpropionate dioxygenase-like ring-hydroxylating dioxygenase large terminal subunit
MGKEETLVPVSKYVDPVRFEREREALFRHTPNLVAHASQLAKPGDFITKTIADTPILLARDEEGRAQAFLNVCRHRGATVEPREQGHCKRFVCPYHAWTYRLDGSLDKVRHRDGFPSLDLQSTSLVRLPTFEAAGFVWTVTDPGADPDFDAMFPAALLEELVSLGSEEAIVFDTSARVWKANWKLAVDGGLESYHFKIAHRDTIAGFFVDNGSTFELVGDHIRSVLPRTSLLGLADEPESEWRIRTHTHLVYSLFPNASLLIQEDHMVLVIMTPLSIDETRIEISSLVPSSHHSTDRAQRHWRANHDFTVVTLDEDFAMAEQIQRGAHSGANEHYRFARFEAALARWHELIDAKLSLG